MQISELSLQVNVADLDGWRELIDCLKKNYDDLPSDVQNALYKLLDDQE